MSTAIETSIERFFPLIFGTGTHQRNTAAWKAQVTNGVTEAVKWSESHGYAFTRVEVSLPLHPLFCF